MGKLDGKVAIVTGAGRVGTAEDCARVVEFLATGLPDYVTGAVIPVDGALLR